MGRVQAKLRVAPEAPAFEARLVTVIQFDWLFSEYWIVAVSPTVVDLLSAVGLQRPDINLLDDRTWPTV